MRWRFVTPNSPILVSDNFVSEVENQDFIADIKIDGYRVIITKSNNTLSFLSKSGKKHSIPSQLISKFNDLPNNTELDAEWINPSRIKCINKSFGAKLPMINHIVVFDIRWYNNEFLGKSTLRERRNIPYYKSLTTVPIDKILKTNMNVYKVVSSSKIGDLYKRTQKEIILEGIIIKNQNGTLNSTWYKMKYRQ